MTIRGDDHKIQIWHRLVVRLTREPAFLRTFMTSPAAILCAEGLINDQQLVVVQARPDASFDVVVYPGPSDADVPERLVLPEISQLRQYFKKLPSNSSAIVAGPGCGIPGGCSGSF